MRRAVYFDDESMFAADEIREERPDRLLAHEFLAAEAPASERAPQALFGAGLSRPQLAAAMAFVEMDSAHRNAPRNTPSPSPQPSPRKRGEGV